MILFSFQWRASNLCTKLDKPYAAEPDQGWWTASWVLSLEVDRSWLWLSFYTFLYFRTVVNGILAQVASNLKTSCEVTDEAFWWGKHQIIYHVPQCFLGVWLENYVQGLGF